MSSQDDFHIVWKQIFWAMWCNCQESCEEIISMGFMTLFQWQFVSVFSQTTHKRHYLKTKNLYMHAANILLLQSLCWIQCNQTLAMKMSHKYQKKGQMSEHVRTPPGPRKHLRTQRVQQNVQKFDSKCDVAPCSELDL